MMKTNYKYGMSKKVTRLTKLQTTQDGSTGQMFWSTSIHDTTLDQYANIERTKNYNFLIKGYQGGEIKISTDLEAIFFGIKQEYQESVFDQYNLNIGRMGKILSLENDKKIISSWLTIYKSTLTMFISKEIKDNFNNFFTSKRIAIKKNKEEQIKEIVKKIRAIDNKINKNIGLLEKNKQEGKTVGINEHIISTGLSFEPAIQINMNTTLSQYVVYLKKATERIKLIKEQQSKRKKNG